GTASSSHAARRATRPPGRKPVRRACRRRLVVAYDATSYNVRNDRDESLDTESGAEEHWPRVRIADVVNRQSGAARGPFTLSVSTAPSDRSARCSSCPSSPAMSRRSGGWNGEGQW